jgi:hypothetical protein
MPLVEPTNQTGNFLREKILLIGPGKAGKSSCWLSIAFWAHISGDQRKFFVLDTDQAVRDVMNEPRYAGMLAEEGGNVHLFDIDVWNDYIEATEKIMTQVQRGDWIVIDFVTHAWQAVREAYVKMVAGKTVAESRLDAAKEGLSGWDLFTADENYNVINPMYFDWIKKPLLRSGAHIFMVAEQGEIFEQKKMQEKDKEHLAQWGKWKAEGQKKLPYQCRSYLRIQRLARGRVLFTLGDRARKEFEGDTIEGDFFKTYMIAAGWKVTDPG